MDNHISLVRNCFDSNSYFSVISDESIVTNSIGGVMPSNSSSESALGRVSMYLADLPSRGLFSSTVVSSSMGGMPVYICQHDTSPPEDQLIKTDQMNTLVRSLMLKKGKNGKSKAVKGTTSNEGSRKRRGEEVETENAAPSKKAMTGAHSYSCEGVSNSGVLDKDLHSLTVERLRELSRENGLSPKGRKDELIARLRLGNRKTI